MNRKDWKRNAKSRLMKHYLLFLFLCLFLGMIGFEYKSSFSAVKSFVASEGSTGEAVEEEDTFLKVIDLMLEGDLEKGRTYVRDNQQELTQEQEKLGIVSIGHSRGVLSQLVVFASSGAILTTLTEAIASVLHSEDGGIVLMILASILFTLFLHLFLLNVVNATIKRIFLEGRLYDHVPAKRMLFFQRVKKWIHVAKILFLTNVFSVLWMFTIVGGIIKKYSYMMVPYIVAENPVIGAREAITLSRKMMHGHKLEAFKLHFSFILWHILDGLTFGLTGILFSNPYEEATLAEYYAYVRKQAIDEQIPGYEKFNDTYLFDIADASVLKNAYSDVEITTLEKEDYSSMMSVKRFFRNILGICLFYDQDEDIYEARMLQEELQKDTVNILNGKQYPGRLFSIPEKDKVKQIEHINYMRHYSVCSIILIFFTMCMIGWLWEVSLHLVTDGVFVNRGILHGPWLPIYGFGGVLILLILYRFRKNPVLLFIAAVVLCGILEYSTSWYLEMTHDGMKWWDYSGYFINIHGRICAEGLLVFGVGGIAIIYILAPLLDNLFRRIPLKIAAVICLILVASYISDQIYSGKHPNMGKGITDYTDIVVEEEIIT